LRHHLAAGQHLDPRNQLDELEGLRQIVIAARAQPANALVNRRQRAEDQDRCLDPDRAQSRQYAETVEIARQHPIEDDCIVSTCGGFQQPVTPGVGTVRLQAGVTESRYDLRGGPKIVLNDQHPAHSRPIMRCRPDRSLQMWHRAGETPISFA
jgi:hypothetical protein